MLLRSSGQSIRPPDTSYVLCKATELKRQVEEVAREFGVSKLDDWYKVPRTDVYKRAPFMIDRYGSLFETLKAAYPNHPWNKSLFNLYSSISWNQLCKKMGNISKEFNVQVQDEWYRISRDKVYKKAPLLHGNLYNALKTVYPDQSWDKSRFKLHPRGYWNDLSNQQKRVEEVAIELNIKQLDDWYKVPKVQVYNNISFITSHYGSLFGLLKSIYPHHNWDETRFRTSQKKLDEHREKLEEFASEFHVQQLDDWYKVSRKQVYKKLKFIQKNYGTLFDALKQLYPEHKWDVFKFERAPLGLWSSSNASLFKEVLHEQMKKYNIQQYSDWLQIPREELKLFHRISKNFYVTTRNLLTSLNVHHTIESSKQELVLRDMLSATGDVEVHARIDGYSVDAYIPQLAIAVEYQGEYHYKQLNTGHFREQRIRDTNKKEALEKLGIRLVHVPYWWKVSLPQLMSTITTANK